jgi:hypothetical protein
MIRLAAALFVAAMALPHGRPEVLFAVVDDSQGDGLAIEPVAMVTKVPGPCAGCWKVTFAKPPYDAAEEFVARYYHPGRTYRVLAGGVDVGTAKVDKETDLGCVSLAASVTVTPPRSKREWNRLRLLAVGSLHVAPRKPVRRYLTAPEEKAIWSLADREFRARGVPASLFKDMEGGTFISDDLDHDGRRDLIGSFRASDAKAQATYELFLIALGDAAGGYQAEYVWYFPPTKSENRAESMALVDTLDLDEDGTDEVIVSKSFYESHEYGILKRGRSGKWTMVYRGGGSGC